MRHFIACSILIGAALTANSVMAQDAPAETSPTMEQIIEGLGQDDTEQAPAVETSTTPEHAVTTTPEPLENMNPALLPKPDAPAPGSAVPGPTPPQAEGADTPPVPAKPPAYNAQPFVVLQTLDKVTARTGTITVKVGDTVAIGPLFVQVKTCQQAAPLETPDSAAFLQVWEAKPTDGPSSTDKSPSQWVFSGWMFASSPALSAMDHPIYDIWVSTCQATSKKPVVAAPEKAPVIKDDKKDAPSAEAEKPAKD